MRPMGVLPLEGTEQSLWYPELLLLKVGCYEGKADPCLLSAYLPHDSTIVMPCVMRSSPDAELMGPPNLGLPDLQLNEKKTLFFISTKLQVFCYSSRK